jgi:phosphatidate cytidylyltransferase
MWRKLVVRNRLILGLAGFIVLLPTWLALSRLQNSGALLLILLAVIWIADSAAYFTGRSMGKRKLAPAISPGKTWEGVIGAFVAVIVYALALYVSGLSTLALPLLIAAFIAMVALGVTGDLYESWLKRSAGVKDSGSILPGHGGLLDRLDAVAAALPAAALIFI